MATELPGPTTLVLGAHPSVPADAKRWGPSFTGVSIDGPSSEALDFTDLPSMRKAFRGRLGAFDKVITDWSVVKFMRGLHHYLPTTSFLLFLWSLLRPGGVLAIDTRPYTFRVECRGVMDDDEATAYLVEGLKERDLSFATFPIALSSEEGLFHLPMEVYHMHNAKVASAYFTPILEGLVTPENAGVPPYPPYPERTRGRTYFIGVKKAEGDLGRIEQSFLRKQRQANRMKASK